MDKLIGIEGRTDLVRDPNSPGIMNTDHNALKQAKLAKKRIMEEIKQRKSVEDRLLKLESLVDQLLKDKLDG